MPQLRRARCTVAVVFAAALCSAPVLEGQREGAPAQPPAADAGKKPSLSLRATPPVGFSPLRVSLVAELKGGPNDFADLYCASIEWDWGDGTKSENGEDCAPYEAGKSEIRRRFTATHTFRYADNYRVYIRLKQKDRIVAASTANVQVRAGIREGFE
jgi:hypothetical protein